MNKTKFLHKMIDRHLREHIGFADAEKLKRSIRIKLEIHRGNYIAVCLRDQRLKHDSWGFAKRRPDDVFDPEIGFCIAATRAVVDLYG